MTEDAGGDLAAQRERGGVLGPENTWDWNRDARGRTVAYGELDATGVRQQGLRGEVCEGRMPWVAAVLNPRPLSERGHRKHPHQARYVSGVMGLPEIGRQCQSVGLSKADVVVARTDGGAGLEDCLIDALGGLVSNDWVFILDFHHAGDHLRQFARAWLEREEERAAWLERTCHLLKESGGAAALGELETLQPGSLTAAAREVHRQLLGYLRNNVHRMDYPRYVSRGWQIGSGAIESACKNVVGRRLKGPGMRWRERGTTALCQLRSLYCCVLHHDAPRAQAS